MRKPRALPLLLAALMLCLTVFPAAAAGSSQSAKATTMQLMKTEGTVNVTNASGRSLTKRDNMLLYNGYHVETKAKSYAWINLDSSKLIKLDAVSEAEVRKSGKSLELLLNSGSFFFNVSSPLKEGETLNIRTATMVVGIRGTSGWFKAVDRWSTEIYVLEGTVQCSVSDPVTGQAKEATNQSGERAVATAYPQDYAGDKCDIVQEKFEPGDIDGFVLEELAQNPELCADIFTKSGLDVMSAVEATQERREQDEQKMQDVLDRIGEQQAEQDSGTSPGPVWGQEDPAPNPPPASSGRDDQDDSGDRDDTGGSVPDTPTVPNQPSDQPRTLNNWETAQDVQDALEQAWRDGIRVVFLELNSAQSNTALNINIPMTICEEMTLAVTGYISVTVQKDSQLTVNGTMVVNGRFVNDGVLTVTENGLVSMQEITGSGTLYYSGDIDDRIDGKIGDDIKVVEGLPSDETGGTVGSDDQQSDGDDQQGDSDSERTENVETDGSEKNDPLAGDGGTDEGEKP